MLRAPRTTLFVAFAIAVSACDESFVATGGGAGATTSSTGGASTGGTTTGGGGASSAGSGGGGETCDSTDADGDGYALCDDDCDDTNPFVHPGALEICGDGADEDCDGKDNTGSACQAYSTYVSPKGNPGATGTKDDPVASVAEGVARAMQLGGQAAVLVAAGTYIEDVTVTGKISLVGGYDPDDWSARDPAVHTTTIKSSVPEGVKLVGVDGQMLVDGFTITGRTVNVGPDSSVAVTIDGGGPIVSNTKIAGGPVSAGSGSSIGVRVITAGAVGATARLWLDEITAGPSSGGPAVGLLVDADAMDVQLAGTIVKVGTGTDSVGLLMVNAGKVIAWKNLFQSGAAKGAFNQPSSSLGVWAQKGELLLDANIVNADQINSPPTCFTPGAWCGGVRISTGTATLSNNIVLGSASDRSAAVQLLEQDDDLSGVVVTSNTLYGGGHQAFESASASILIGSPRVDAVVTMVGRFRNNILFGGFATNNYGLWEQRTPGESCDPAALDHNLFFFPINDPNAGVLYSDWTGANATDVTNIDDLPGDGANLEGDPKLDNSHLTDSSPCRNKGTDLDAPNHDMDEDLRPQEGTFDIGPDEFVSK